ncbi:MAG: GWxTD domain-containing protein [Candidatus Aminicenantales bacterium]
MRRGFGKIALFYLVASLPVFSDVPRLKEKDLPLKYQEWLKLTSYIILSKEKDVFLQLTTDRDRDIFIESFWKQRDPTPGTPQNEFKEEHIKRFNYANTYFRRGTPREGWQTDMGRIYIILGPPASIERFDSVPGLYPAQVWYYYGDQSKGLPNYFAVVFFQRSGAGEFKLYNPTSDGPLSLIIDSRGIDITDYRAQYEKIKELAPTLAGVAISMIPGQYPFNFQPSPQANIILGDIFESPKKNISTTYATHFLDYKGIVSTEYLTNFVESTGLAVVVREPILDMALCHFSVAPKKISVDYFSPKDQYFCNFKLDASLRQGDRVVFQSSKDFPFYFEPDRLAVVEANGIALQDVFPVIEGRSQLTVLVQNSVGKEFTVFEKTIEVPALLGSPGILGPVLGFSMQNFLSPAQAPFKFVDKQLQVDPANMFTLKDSLTLFLNLTEMTEDVWRDGVVQILIRGLREKSPLQKSFSLRTRDYPFHQVMGIVQEFPLQEFVPDYYELTLTLNGNGGKTIASASSSFIVSPQAALSRPVTLSKSFSFDNLFLYHHILAEQYERVDEMEKAGGHYEKALALKPDYQAGIVAYANCLLKTHQYDRALELIERISLDEKLRFEYYLIKGLALEGKGKFEEAVSCLREGNRIYNSDTRLLNSLGFCYYKTGQKKAALEALQASLRLNPEQSEIRALIGRIEKELR